MPRAALIGLVALLLSCQQPPPPAVDAHGYLAALQARDAAPCAAISDPNLAGECAGMLAHERALGGDSDGAIAMCEAMVSGGWRDECFFLVADAAALAGPDAKRVCASAGQFRNLCLSHAIGREVTAILEATGIGEEAEAIVALDGAVGGYILGQERAGRVRKFMAGHIAQRSPDAPFSLAMCGTAPQHICQEAYVERVRSAEHAAGRGSGSWRRACGKSVSAQRAAGVGLPTWEPDFDALAEAAWRQLCGG